MTYTDLGLTAAVSGLVAAVVTVPFGSLVDRVNRTRLLAAGILLWAVVMAGCSATQSFTQLVLIRCALGAVIAVAGPATASLIGDFFSPAERGRIWSYALTGELIGAGFGFAVAGSLASLSWRLSFGALALPALVLAVLVWQLPEPARGGGGRIPEDAMTVGPEQPKLPHEPADHPIAMSVAQAAVHEDVAPYDHLVLDEDPREWSLWHAVRYVLRIRTNVILIAAGSAAYFFFSGARAFGIEYVKPQYRIGQTLASSLTLILGVFAVAGAVASGWYSDRHGRRGHLRARVTVAAAMLGVATVALIPALLVSSFVLGIAFLGIAMLALAAVNPPVDAGRLDIMHPTLWGRAEAVRGLLKQPAESLAPLLFGVLADHLFGGGHAGLQATFLIMIAPLALAVLVVLRARSSYPRDVATAAESIRRTCSWQ
jgi:MFS family permease